MSTKLTANSKIAIKFALISHDNNSKLVEAATELYKILRKFNYTSLLFVEATDALDREKQNLTATYSDPLYNGMQDVSLFFAWEKVHELLIIEVRSFVDSCLVTNSEGDDDDDDDGDDNYKLSEVD